MGNSQNSTKTLHGNGGHTHGTQSASDHALAATMIEAGVEQELCRRGTAPDAAKQIAISAGAMIRFSLAGAGLAVVVAAALAMAGVQ